MTEAADHLVTLDDAGVLRGGRWLVRNVDLNVRAGEVVTLIGPNGAGKSTTIKLALGLLSPDEGVKRQRQGLKVSYVPQSVDFNATLPLTVGRFMNLRGLTSRKTLEMMMEETGVASLRSRQMSELSGGEFQRVMMARAMARKPDLLVLDEPVQGVDFAGESAMYDLIKNFRDRSGCGVLLSSHDLHIVMAATDRVICLNGRVHCQGSPVRVATSETYKELFGLKSASLALYAHESAPHSSEAFPSKRDSDAG